MPTLLLPWPRPRTPPTLPPRPHPRAVIPRIPPHGVARLEPTVRRRPWHACDRNTLGHAIDRCSPGLLLICRRLVSATTAAGPAEKPWKPTSPAPAPEPEAPKTEPTLATDTGAAPSLPPLRREPRCIVRVVRGGYVLGYQLRGGRG